MDKGCLYRIYSASAFITHIWTVIIAFTKGGLIAGIISLFVPFLAELYWVYQMMGIKDVYVTIAIIHLVLAIPFVWLIGKK